MRQEKPTLVATSKPVEQRESVMLNSDIFSKFSELYVSADDVNVDLQPSLV